MKSALGLVAFSSGCHVNGICGLIETAIEAMIANGHDHAAAHAQMSLDTFILEEAAQADQEFAEISILG